MSYKKLNSKWSWESYEIEYLKDNYNKRSNQQIAITLNRKPAAIAMKLKRLNLKRDVRENEGQFKHGNKLKTEFPINYISFMNINGKNVAMIKTEKGWKNAASHFWALANGPVPKGYYLKYIDNDYTNYNLENLKLLPKRKKNENI